MKLAFFGYAWNPKFQTDAYMTATIASLVDLGADIDVFLGNQISQEYGIYGLKPEISLDQINGFIAAEGYDAAISFNNSMLIPEVTSALDGRVASIIVDEPEHLFDYRRTGPMAALKDDVEIVAMSTAVEQRILREVEGAAPRLHFMLPATHVRDRRLPVKAAYPISWVASYVGDANLDQYIALMMERPDYYALTQRCLELLARKGDLNTLRSGNAREMTLIDGLPWTYDYFVSQMRNILTNRSRVEVVERLAPHGLALFGNQGWHKLLTHNGAVLKALQPGSAPSLHEDLLRIYDGSKISINAPQNHIANGAVQYRVIDVMASNALMITRRDEPSDLTRVFGADCPVPTYADFHELEQLCRHYLGHERERRDLVARCNALLTEGFDFSDRARRLLQIVGLEPKAGAPKGNRRSIDLRLFTAD